MDPISNREKSKSQSHEKHPLKPLFKEAAPDDSDHKRHRSRRYVNPQDKKNFLYIILAAFVALVILLLLELKQLNDQRAENGPGVHADEQVNN